MPFTHHHKKGRGLSEAIHQRTAQGQPSVEENRETVGLVDTLNDVCRAPLLGKYRQKPQCANLRHQRRDGA